jgi:hypothetical protein
MTAPLTAHGVGTDRRTRWACGMRASICDSVSECGRRARAADERRDAVEGGGELRQDEAAAPVPAEDDAVAGARAGQVVG